MCDVSLPLNIDDADLYPKMDKLPSAKKGWTAMTFSLINIDLVKSMQKLAAIAASSSSPTEDVRAQIIQETRVRIEERLEHCNSVVPQHRMTRLCSRFLLRKLDFITRQQWLLLQVPKSPQDFATEENLIEALEIVEPRLVSEDGLLKQFAWARKAYPQYHITTYILWHLCVKPEGPNVDRAWEAINALFSPEQWDDFTSGFGSKSAVLKALRAKAISVRDKTQSLNQGANSRNNNDSDLGLETGGNQSGPGTIPTFLHGDMGSGGLDFGVDSDQWPNWAALMQDFQPDDQSLPSFFWQ